ncbi:hypothetical protein EDC30_11378 [Paucimonas lemoignei]|uniref:Uncharacterized protein n=1 Tax=Paucimonas lemoignei TaxID=29443 RepID=A0A4R3HT07_PAULE|nr:hypothetical protein [Paucimonas lemoignei]TCS34382.1 hypothetical protein EDC30_11378 [Paucimonas lemoignei]
MPAIQLIVSEAEHKKLQEDYEKLSALWIQQGRQSSPPPFEHWIGERLMNANRISAEGIDHMRVFSAVEQLITSMHVHGFCLAHVVGQTGSPEKSSQEFAEALVRHFELPTQYIKRLQDVFTYYQKDASSLTDNGSSKAPAHASTTIESTFEELLERTTTALDHLGTERAIGRVEGALALLVNLGIMERETAREKTQAFKALARGMKKT